MSLLHIEKLTLRFGGLTAVNRVDADVEEGQIVSIIGPNGAGKTTVFNAVTGIYEPTEGRILFQGRDPARPFRWPVMAGCLLVGLFTAIVAALLTADVDRLWKATIKRNFDPENPQFSWSAARRDFWRYYHGDLAVERVYNQAAARISPWKIVSADGRFILTDVLGKRPQDLRPPRIPDTKRLFPGEYFDGLFRAAVDAAYRVYIETVAGRYAADIAEVLDLPPERRMPQEVDDHWQIRSLDGRKILTNYNSEEEAERKTALLNELSRSIARRRFMAWISLLVGLAIGSSGTYVVWQRSRRTPDVIAGRGIARTFQNIRLFQNMTVLDNVLLGMNRTFRVGWLRTIFRTPGWKREEADARGRALKLLEFIGLEDQCSALAKNLPYGDQRRLEIARALATKPKLILLDEPAAGMNPTESGELMKLIRRIREQGVTVLLIEHHMKVVMGISDRIAVLDYGQKIAEGTPAEVRANPRVIEAYLGKEETK